MKKLFASIFIFFAIFCMTGCSSPMKATEKCPNNLNSAFSAKMSFTLDKLNAEGTIKRLADGEWETEFDSPNTLSGVCLKFSSGNVTASYKGLAFSVPRSALPAKAMLLNLIDAVDSNARSEELKGTVNEDMLELSGALDSGEYTITVNDGGYISSFSMPNNLLKIAFSDMEVLSSQQPSQTQPALTAAVGETTTACTTETAADAQAQAAEQIIDPQADSNNPEED